MDTQNRERPAAGQGERGAERCIAKLPYQNHTTASVDTLLPRLESVRETGPGCWLARCPAHDDKRPSLSVKQADDRILVHCFGGCPSSDVVAAVGLSLADLFDRPLTHNGKPLSQRQRRRYGQAVEALKALRHESLVVLIAADRMAAGYRISGDDMDRLHVAHQRIRAASGVSV